MNAITVRGVPFVYKDRDGDFTFMRTQKKYENSLLIYNDNFCDSLVTEKNTGAGSAAVRDECWRFSDNPRTAGVPTGWSAASGGFDEANKFSQIAIDCALDRIRLVLTEKPEITEVIFSSSRDDDKKIGSCIFKIEDKIVDYISRRLFELEHFDRATFQKTHASIDSRERILIPYALLHRKCARLEDELRHLKRMRTNEYGSTTSGYGYSQSKLSRYF